MNRRQPYVFGFADTALAEAGGVPLDALHRDAEAIAHCYARIAPLAKRLKVTPPPPRLAGFAYCHVSTLGAEIIHAEGSEPNVVPLLKRPEDIDTLEEPDDYLARGVTPMRLAVLERLRMLYPNAARSIGHLYEGPVTTAALLMGPGFFRLPYEDPARAHRLLLFCVRSAVNYARAIRTVLGEAIAPGPVSIPDDFAGIFAPDTFAAFVTPYWDRMYEALCATKRYLHSELLRPVHLPFLAALDIAEFDPSADQYVTPELLRAQCPVPFTGRIQSWHIADNSPEELQALYRRIAACQPTRISFYMTFLHEEDKIAAILDTARELAGEE